MDANHRFRYRLEFLAARGAFAALGSLPKSVGPCAARALGRAVGFFAGRRSRLAAANMRRAFPDARDGQIHQWVRELWENLGQTVWEFSWSARLSGPDFLREADIEGLEHLRRSEALGKGVILFTGHYANWEMICPLVALSGFTLAAVARRMKNPYFNDFLTGLRSRHDARVFMHKNAVRESIRWLRNGHTLGLLIDQRITDGGAKVPFFGQPAHTTTLPALLALRLGSAVHPCRCVRENGRLRVIFSPAMDFTGLVAREEDIREATARMNAVLEGWVRERPPLWLWIHDRWK